MMVLDWVKARPRTYLAFAVMIGVALAPLGAGMPTRLLIAWNAGALLWLALAFRMMARSDVARMRERAAKQDDGAAFVLVVSCAAAALSLVAIGAELSNAKEATANKAPHVALAVLTILSSWFFVHTTFALHYAHEFYGDRGQRGGLAFPHTKEADYWDFAYFAVNLGAASQTSDVQITSQPMRRVVLAHSVLAFFLNTTVLALGINVAASLL